MSKQYGNVTCTRCGFTGTEWQVTEHIKLKHPEPKQWTPDTWETLCVALAKDKDLKVWVWYYDTYNDIQLEEHLLIEYMEAIYCDVAKASLKDPRTKD